MSTGYGGAGPPAGRRAQLEASPPSGTSPTSPSSDELRELVAEAWLSKAPPRLARAWLERHAEPGS